MTKRPFTRVLTWLLLAIVGASSADAQEPDSEPANEGRGYFMVGVATVDLGRLNDRLGSRGYPSLPETMLSVGGGGHGVRGRWVLGGEGAALIGRAKESTQGGVAIETTLTGGYGFFNLGYLVVKQRDLHVYPLIGVGGGGAQLTFNETTERTFDELLENPRGSATASTGGFLMQAALGIDNLFVLGTEVENGRRREGGVVLGVRVGYVFGPGQGDWRLGGTRLGGGPELGLTGPYVRVVVGGGGRDF